jgi:hypothetical protein
VSEERVPRGRRLLFQVVVGILMALLLLVFVIQPAVARGGFGELVIVAAIFLAILFVERWLRTR